MKTKKKLANILSQVPKKHQKQFLLLLKGEETTKKFNETFNANQKMIDLFDQAIAIQDKWFAKLVKLIAQ